MVEKKKTRHSMSGWWCGACGMPYDWRKPNRSAEGPDRVSQRTVLSEGMRQRDRGAGQEPHREQQEQVGGFATFIFVHNARAFSGSLKKCMIETFCD